MPPGLSYELLGGLKGMAITINTAESQVKSREDYRISVKDPDPNLITGEEWIAKHGCSREAARKWHAAVLKSIGK